MSESKFRLPSAVMIGGGAFLLLAALIGGTLFHWTFNRIYVNPDENLLVRYKGPPLPLLPGGRSSATPGQFAKVDKNGSPLEIGILREMKGPGRHFLFYGWYETERVPDTIVKPGEVAVITSRMGKELPQGEFLVDGELGATEFKGVLRRVFAPGRYRINPYAYEVRVIEMESVSEQDAQQKLAGWVEIPAGYVGVVTNLADNPLTGASKGIQESVLPPGLYPINPREQQIDRVEIGYRERSIKSDLKEDQRGNVQLDPSGEPVLADVDSGIGFPSNDGFRINMDFTAVWGIMPDQAPEVIRKFGNVAAVEEKVVVPQIESICRNMGSRLGAVDLLVGDSRQELQESTSAAFGKVLEEKGLTLLYGLVRHIYIPQEVRVPIQQKYIADELKLTREQEQLTARTEANLREAEQKVELEGERIRVETEKMVATAIAEGNKEAEETKAETTKLVAAIDRQTAELEAQATVLLGEATAGKRKLEQEARSAKFALAVQAFGSGMAYNQWVFASGLPEDIQLDMLYAGEGTFWTDLKGFSETMLGRQVQQQQSSSPGNRQTPVSRPAPRR